MRLTVTEPHSLRGLCRPELIELPNYNPGKPPSTNARLLASKDLANEERHSNARVFTGHKSIFHRGWYCWLSQSGELSMSQSAVNSSAAEPQSRKAAVQLFCTFLCRRLSFLLLFHPSLLRMWTASERVTQCYRGNMRAVHNRPSFMTLTTFSIHSITDNSASRK
jgi:hypothetical protein